MSALYYAVAVAGACKLAELAMRLIERLDGC